MLECPNIVGYLRKAASDDELRSCASAWLMRATANGLMQRQRPNGALRMSDAGSCRLEVWYKLHGGHDIPHDAIDMQLVRFDEGSLNGAWAGCLIAQAAFEDGWNYELERVVHFAGVPGHIDVRLFRDDPNVLGGVRSHVVEIKSKYESSEIKNPEKESPFQLLQAGGYANCDEEDARSQTFTLLVLSPSAKKGVRAKQFHFDAAPYSSLVAQDFIRLRAALEDEPPVGDPADKWRCFTCNASKCAKNKNRQVEDVEALFA